ncbi:YHYH domain-containing protein [Woeseiaceae bacterium]|jgi:hypothetical protein|nr:YHYH domain-containing protein [Woeseiaceae bacterium]
MNKLSKLLLALIFVSLSTLSFGHSGRTDSNGGHNCSQKSKKKGLCSGYHYHNSPRVTDIDVIIEEKNEVKEEEVITETK